MFFLVFEHIYKLMDTVAADIIYFVVNKYFD